MKFFKALSFLVRFQFAITRRFFKDGYWKDYGIIEASLLTRTYLKKYAEVQAEIERELDHTLSKMTRESKDPSNPNIRLVPKGDDRLN